MISLVPPQQPALEPGLLASLGWVDLTALAILIVFLVLGLFRGFVWQISRILTLVVAYVVAGVYGETIAGSLRRMISGINEDLALYIAYFAVFVVVLIVVSVIAYFLEKLVDRTGLSFYNRIGGGVLGVVTGAALVLALLFAVFAFFGAGSGVVDAARRSHSMTVSQRTLTALGDMVPAKVREVFGLDEPREDADERPR
jgi:membrane protein required for colicin V production